MIAKEVKGVVKSERNVEKCLSEVAIGQWSVSDRAMMSLMMMSSDEQRGEAREQWV